MKQQVVHVLFYGDDAYELVFADGLLTAIVRYRGGLNVKGELVNLTNLPYGLQEKILRYVKNESRKRVPKTHYQGL